MILKVIDAESTVSILIGTICIAEALRRCNHLALYTPRIARDHEIVQFFQNISIISPSVRIQIVIGQFLGQ